MKIKYLLFLFPIVIFCTTSLHSQNTELIDSLKTELASRKEDDSIKIRILTRLHEKLMYSKPEEAKQYAEQELKISKIINYTGGIALGNMHVADYHANKNENDTALYYYKIAKDYFNKAKRTRGVIFVNYTLSYIESINGNLDKAIEISKENIELIKQHEKEGDAKTKFIAASYGSLADIYIEKGNYKIALIKALKALKHFEDINHETRKAGALKQIGDIESRLEHYESSIKYFKEAVEIYERFEDKFSLAYTYNALGISYKNLNNYEAAEENYDLATFNAREVDDKLSICNALHNLGDIKRIKKDYTEGKKILLKAKVIAEKENLKLSLVNIYHSLSKIDHHFKNFTEALKNNTKSIEISKSLGATSHLANIYRYRATLLEDLNKSNDALSYLKLYQKLNDSLFTTKKSQQIEELKTIYETEKKEAEIALQNEEIETLNEKAKVNKLTKTLYGGGAISGIALSGLLFFGFRQRMKKNKIEREKQNEIYKQEIAFKQKELASQTLHLVQKNTFLQELKENLENIKNSPDKFKVEFRRIVMLLKKQNADNKDWEVFKSYFSEVHDNFDNKIKAVYRDITEKELRLASFIKMNLSTKEIAAMLNVLPDSVLKSKYRLKKKLALNKETDLYQFLINL